MEIKFFIIVVVVAVAKHACVCEFMGLMREKYRF
jgi:hypothetical protein